MMEYRVRTKRSEEWVDHYKGAQVTPEMVNLLLRSEARVLRPDGKPLCVYLPGAAKAVADATYPEFSRIRVHSHNRGNASGMAFSPENNRNPDAAVLSTILGSIDRSVANPACRLTAFNAKEVERWETMVPFFQRVADLLREHVPERYAAQVAEAQRTNPAWVISGTPFTTITVNNTYPTGVHTDKGDLDAGFSTLAVMRRGAYRGGWIGFPQYGVFADMQDGDVLLMDAHDWHGNTPLVCSYCAVPLRRPGHQCDAMPADTPSPERVSVVSYFRTAMVSCGSAEEESARWNEARQRQNERVMGL